MIKRFNENWGTFEDYIEANEPTPKKDSHMQKWKEYWDKISRDVNTEMDSVAVYAKEHSISYEEALEILSRYEKEIEEKDEVRPPVKFDTGTEVVGLPSGQVIYMPMQAIKYFKSRNLITYKKTWKKPIAGGMIPIEINQYTFEDKLLPKIMDQMETIYFT